LAGNIVEWTLDLYGTYAASQSSNYANVSSGTERTGRGGMFGEGGPQMRTANRYSGSAATHTALYGMGLRCARAPE